MSRSFDALNLGRENRDLGTGILSCERFDLELDVELFGVVCYELAYGFCSRVAVVVLPSSGSRRARQRAFAKDCVTMIFMIFSLLGWFGCCKRMSAEAD